MNCVELFTSISTMLIFDLHSALTLPLYFINKKLTKHEQNEDSIRVQKNCPVPAFTDYTGYFLHVYSIQPFMSGPANECGCREASDQMVFVRQTSYDRTMIPLYLTSTPAHQSFLQTMIRNTRMTFSLYLLCLFNTVLF